MTDIGFLVGRMGEASLCTAFVAGTECMVISERVNCGVGRSCGIMKKGVCVEVGGNMVVVGCQVCLENVGSRADWGVWVKKLFGVRL